MLIKKGIVILILILSINKVHSQTILSPGDMMIIGLNTSSDAVSFVTLVDLCAGTVFYVTDCAYRNATGFCTGQVEFCTSYTVTSPIPAGTKIRYTDASYPTVGAVSLSPSVGAVTAAYAFTSTAGTDTGWSAGGDNIFIFQGTYSAPSFVCGFKNSGAWNTATGSTSVTCSNKSHTELPSTLTNGINALFTTGCTGTRYNCSVVLGSKSALTGAMATVSNFNCSGSAVVLPPPCGFTLSPNPGSLCFLPIELINFNAERIESANMITWQTATETNNDYFLLEKSVDGIDFNEIAHIKGAGNSVELNDYYFLDKHINNNIVYYRLKQVDFDGTFTYSNIIDIGTENTTENILLLRPNPANDIVEFDINNPKRNEMIFIEVYDSKGNIVKQSIEKLVDDSITVLVNIQNLRQGLYLFKISFQNSGKTFIQRLLKN